MVCTMQFHRVLLWLVVLLATLSSIDAQIINTKQAGNKTIECMRSGMFNNPSDCGVRSYKYTYVFVGAISAIKSIADGESEIKIKPEEIFYGKPDDVVGVITSGKQCLPDFIVGNRWLFYLSKEPGKPIILDSYGNDSFPLPEAQEQINILRRLQTIGYSGILKGALLKSSDSKNTISNVRVVATSQLDNKQYVAVTDRVGCFKFEPLSPGKYRITLGPNGEEQLADNEVLLTAGVCLDLMLFEKH